MYKKKKEEKKIEKENMSDPTMHMIDGKHITSITAMKVLRGNFLNFSENKTFYHVTYLLYL